MKKEVYPIQNINGFSPLLLDYLSNKPELKPFFGEKPCLESFENQIKLKSNFSTKKREVLVNVLKEQYSSLGRNEVIELLENKNTFTVTTGHQLNIFTGPLYVIYKIVSTINLARSLKKQYPDFNFVPIYWLASEDHDFEEINHFFWHNQKHTWQSKQKGAVGKFNPKELSHVFKDFPETVQFFKEAYLHAKTLSEAVIAYMDYLFGDEGLLCLDADHQSLKEGFKSVMVKDILEQGHESVVQKTTQDLQDLGYKTQVNARNINFFYLKDEIRERIEKDNGFKVINTEYSFDQKDLATEIEHFPERFSPNVILRPLYQETILPNLAYIGGPAALVYWLQLKGIFDLHQIPFPILFPRNFVTILEPNHEVKLKRIGLEAHQLFLDTNELKQVVLSLHGSGEQNLQNELKGLNDLYECIEEKAKKIDFTLIQSVKSHLKRSINAFDKIQHKLQKAELRNQKEWLEQIERLQSSLFPNGTWQERRDSFLNYYPQNKRFIKDLLDLLDPLSFEMNFLHQDTNDSKA